MTRPAPIRPTAEALVPLEADVLVGAGSRVARALAVPIVDRAGSYTGRVRVLACPYCGGRHEHGVSPWGSPAGSRSAHCGPDAAGHGDYDLNVNWRSRVPEVQPRRRRRSRRRRALA